MSRAHQPVCNSGFVLTDVRNTVQVNRGYGPIVYVAVATELLLKPLATAIALIVVVWVTEIGAVYRGELVVGVVPLVV